MQRTQTMMLALLLSLVTWGCGSSGGGGGGGDPSDAATSEGTTGGGTTAGGTGEGTTGGGTGAGLIGSEGGEVWDEGGKASVSIPPGALAAETAITVTAVEAAELPLSEQLTTGVYDFGPDGTSFSVPFEGARHPPGVGIPPQ